MNRIMRRKLILLGLAVILCLTYIAQRTVTGKIKAKHISFEEEADNITIVYGQDSVLLTRSNGTWRVGSKGYEAEDGTVQSMLRSLKDIVLLGTASKNPSRELYKYGLSEEERICVTARLGEKQLRTVYIGKNTSTGNQCYVQVDQGAAVYLAKGALHSTFLATEDSVRSKRVYSLNASDVTGVSVENRAEATSFSLIKTDDVWHFPDLSSTTGTLDNAKVSSWVLSLLNLSASSWANENISLAAFPVASRLILYTTSGEFSVTLYTTEDEDEFLCESSAVPYPFYLSHYTAQKFQKSVTELFAEEQ